MLKSWVGSLLLLISSVSTEATDPSERWQQLSHQADTYKNECPRFMCNDVVSEKESFSRHLNDQVFCFKSDFADPLNVYIKDCSRVAYEQGTNYDVFGNPFAEGADRT